MNWKNSVSVAVFITILFISTFGYCTDYEYIVRKVKLQYDSGGIHEIELSDKTLTLRDGFETLPSINLGLLGNIPEGTINGMDLYLYRQQGDTLWDKDGYLGWNFLNGQTITVASDTYKSVTAKVAWNGLSINVVDPSIE
jgi:hypothetical protein